MSESNNNQNSELQHSRERVLIAALPHVPFEGWSRAALAQGVRDAGLEPEAVHRVFPGGVPELVEYFSTYTDMRMEAVLAETDLEAMKLRDRIATAVRVRLELLARHREAVRRLCSYLALPQNTPLGMKCLYRTVDVIWRAVGDESTDFSFYTKRALLAGVYSATLLYWLEDDSEDFEDTFAFLERRIGDIMEIQRARARVEKTVSEAADRIARLGRGAPGRT